MAKKEQKNKPKFSSFAAKNKFKSSTKDVPAERNPGLERHNQEKTALLDDPGPFMETMSGNRPNSSNVALLDLPAKEINDGYKEYGFNEYPVSGDDLAKMGDNRVRSAFAKPILQHYSDVPEDREHYVTPRSETFHTARQQAGM
jgi:hypothetical protein